MKAYVIENKEGLFYIGHCGKFSNDITKARMFKSPKTAIRHYWSQDNYNDLKVVEITIIIPELGLKITDGLFETYNNWDYRVWKSKNGGNE